MRDPFKKGLYLHYPHYIDGALLNRACEGFLGKHDFSSFMASGSSITDSTRTVFETGFLSVGEDEFNFIVSADGFLYNMVRIMVGTLLDIQAGKIPPDAIPSIIGKRDRSSAGHTAPPDGLYLCEVRYDKF